MPDRILRDELLQSERWLDLADNTQRLAFVCLLTAGDALGDLEGTTGRLWLLWRDACALTDRKQVAAIVKALAAADLIRPYQVDGRELIHIPRYRQRLRYTSKVYPASPWITEKEKQQLGQNSPGAHQAHTRSAPPEVKRSEVKRSEVSIQRVVTNPSTSANSVPEKNASDKKMEPTPKPNGNNNNPQREPSDANRWDKSNEGIDAKARELGITARPSEDYYTLMRRCWTAINVQARQTTTESPAQTIGEVMRAALAHLPPPPTKP